MKKRIWILYVFLGLLAVFLIQLGVFYWIIKDKAINSHPIVLIQSPINQQSVVLNKGFIVHATASADKPLKNIELWVDDVQIAKLIPQNGDPSNMLILSEAWIPSMAGKHSLVVRSMTTDGVIGQASIDVDVVEASQASDPKHIVEEGETLDSVADDFDISVDELSALNSGGAASLAPGDELLLPALASGGSAPTDQNEENDTVVEEEPAQDDAPDSEGSSPESIESVDIEWPFFRFLAPLDPVQLKVEVLRLDTLESYDSMHCYISLAGNTSRWMPDADSNQNTDESFEASNNGRTWNIAAHMANENALRIFWDGDQSVPVDINCVGIAESGLDAVDLGSLHEEIKPEAWGVIQFADSSGGEDRFSLAFRVTWPEKGPDTSIIPPWNVAVDVGQRQLIWDYLPNDGSNPAIDGFAILLNDTFQWTVSRSARSSRLPEQWFNLPCGDEYRFQVVAFVGGYPTGNYSLPSNTALISGGEIGSPGCGQSVMVTYEILQTGEVQGDLSPVYGDFYANEQQLNFDGRPLEDDNFPTTFGLRRNSETYISQIMSGFGDGESQMLVEIPAGNPSVLEIPLALGFEIYHGDQKICSGQKFISETELAADLSGEISTDLPVGSMPDWCKVTFHLSPVGETPVVDPGAPPPLPDIIVENLSVDPSSGKLRIHVRNAGMATWTNKDLVARVYSQDGEVFGTFTWPNSTLAPGEVRILSHGGMDPQPALGACVLMDPDNAVQEDRDRYVESGVLGEKTPYCRPLPDLSIPSAWYDQSTGQLNVVVQNRGETTLTSADADGSLDHAKLAVWLEFAEGRPVMSDFENLDLGARESVTLQIDINESLRERMRGGYLIRVNPENTIAEVDLTNNDYQVEETTRLRLVWKTGWATFCPTNHYLLMGENVSYRNTWDMHLSAYISGGSSRQVVADWNTPEFDATWDDPQGAGWCSNYISDWFEIAGDEELTITRTAGLDIATHGYRWYDGGVETVSAANGFGGTTLVPAGTNEECFTDGLQYRRPVRGLYEIGTGSCDPIRCSGMSEDGIRMLSPIEARSDDLTGYCWWTTTYRLFQEE
ncbi:MAG: hypothetical protein C0410_05085 [Anaerolinea sp.]|nr:hypothetical protein [Anaerolinea sp.]